MVSVITPHSQGLIQGPLRHKWTEFNNTKGKTPFINVTPQNIWNDHKHLHDLIKILPGSKNDQWILLRSSQL